MRVDRVALASYCPMLEEIILLDEFHSLGCEHIRSCSSEWNVFMNSGGGVCLSWCLVEEFGVPGHDGPGQSGVNRTEHKSL